MPDKRDMHKAKSHRNSKSHARPAKTQNTGQSTARAVETSTMMTDLTEPVEAPMMGKKNKSRR
jgi:hypothetical protein